jgi:hypothetical protein
MPLHLQSITNIEIEDLLGGIMEEMEHAEYLQRFGKYILTSKDIFDITNTNKIGEYVYTIGVEADGAVLLDLDITLKSTETVKLLFEEKLNGSSEANEYYNVIGEDAHFQIETVNRYLIEEDNLEEKEYELSLSAFPFKFNLFDSIDDVNKIFGLGKEIEIPGIGKQKVGIAEDFMTRSDMFKSDPDSEEYFSVVVGKVADYCFVEMPIGKNVARCAIVDVETRVGKLKTIVGEDCFDLTNLKKDKVVYMKADVKADFKVGELMNTNGL